MKPKKEENMGEQNNNPNNIPKDGNKRPAFSKRVLVLTLAVTASIIFYDLAIGIVQPKPEELTYTAFLKKMDAGEVSKVLISGNELQAKTKEGDKEGSKQFTVLAPNDPALIERMEKKGVEIEVKKEEDNLFLGILISWFPTILLIGFLVWMFKKQSGGLMGALGGNKAKLLTQDKATCTLEDVAGCDEAKEEIFDIIDILKNPSKYTRLGGKIPKGVLLYGSPGTGKTLLAKAVAGEAGVPFYFVSGSDFVQIFAGLGASRVRDMFEQARNNAPCIIFIDEIDALGKSRGNGIGGAADEREQTLNQLLVEMDGFDNNSGVIIMAATNRIDTLDSALTRPGRFDRQIHVPKPDLAGRIEILRVHLKKMPHAHKLDVAEIARGTPGFSGADLANLVNEAVLNAAKYGRDKITREDIEHAKDKVLIGVERKSAVISEEQKKTTAFHEAGHTIVAKYVKETDPVHKVSIIPRGQALGVTIQLPEKDQLNHTAQYLHDRICILMGGRIGEELALGQKTTGASNDFERASQMARAMVEKWGMSERIGALVVNTRENSLTDISPETAKIIDDEVIRILNNCYSEAKKIVQDHYEEFDNLGNALIKYETLDLDDIDRAMRGEKPLLVPGSLEKEEAWVDEKDDIEPERD